MTEKNKEIIKEIITDFNGIAGTNYNPDKIPKEVVGFINARLSEGHTIDDFKKVHRIKWADWNDTENIKWYRPSTLYRPTRFSQYLNQLSEYRTQLEPQNEDLCTVWDKVVTWCNIPDDYCKSNWNHAIKAVGLEPEDLQLDDHAQKRINRCKVIRHIEYMWNKKENTVDSSVLEQLLNP